MRSAWLRSAPRKERPGKENPTLGVEPRSEVRGFLFTRTLVVLFFFFVLIVLARGLGTAGIVDEERPIETERDAEPLSIGGDLGGGGQQVVLLVTVLLPRADVAACGGGEPALDTDLREPTHRPAGAGEAPETARDGPTEA